MTNCPNDELWETKYIKKTYVEPSLKGANTYAMDKWGAVLYIRNTFGKIQRIYANEKEYLDAIKGAEK